MTILSVNNANLFYEVHGTGEPVILIAGYGCNHLSWQPILDGLSEFFQVVILDNRGVGQTVDDNAALSTHLMARDVIALADQLNLKKPHIIGHSMGGTIAQAVASLYPEKIGKLCLLTTSAKWRQAMLFSRKNLLIMRERDIDFDFIFEADIPWLFGESFLKNDKAIADFKQGVLGDCYPQSLHNQERQFKVLEQFDGTAGLKRIQSPTLIAYGTQDLIALPEESDYIASHIAQSTLVRFDCGHVLTHEVPEQLTRELVHFIQNPL